MWIKSKDGRLHDATGCSIEALPMLPKAETTFYVQLAPRSGKPIVIADVLGEDDKNRVMITIENAIGNGRVMVAI